MKPKQPPLPATTAGADVAPWHAWRRPDVSLARVYACAVYCVPAGMPPARNWAGRCAALLAQCKRFHEQEFPGSALEWALHGPVFLPFTAAAHRGKPDAFYDAMGAAVLAAAKSATLPVAARDSRDADAGAPAAAAAPFLPTVVDFVCFADWGLEAIARAEDLRKYYIAGAAGE